MKTAYLKRILEAVQSIDPQSEIEFLHDDIYDAKEDEDRPPITDTFNIKVVKIYFKTRDKNTDCTVQLIGGSY